MSSDQLRLSRIDATDHCSASLGYTPTVGEKRASKAAAAAEAARPSTKEDQAAVKIQSTARGRQSRQSISKMRKSNLATNGDGMERLPSNASGGMAAIKAAKVRLSQRTNHTNHQPGRSRLPSQSEPEARQEAAAMRVQAAERGRRERQNLTSQKEEGNEQTQAQAEAAKKQVPKQQEAKSEEPTTKTQAPPPEPTTKTTQAPPKPATKTQAPPESAEKTQAPPRQAGPVLLCDLMDGNPEEGKFLEPRKQQGNAISGRRKGGGLCTACSVM